MHGNFDPLTTVVFLQNGCLSLQEKLDLMLFLLLALVLFAEDDYRKGVEVTSDCNECEIESQSEHHCVRLSPPEEDGTMTMTATRRLKSLQLLLSLNDLVFRIFECEFPPQTMSKLQMSAELTGLELLPIIDQTFQPTLKRTRSRKCG